RRLAAAALRKRPPIQLPCNEEVPGFAALVLPPHPPGAMHPLAREEVDEASGIPVAGEIEAAWQEGDGCYVQGWLHAYGRRVISVAIQGPGRRLPILRLAPRPDLLGRYPTLPEPAPSAGFALFVPWRADAGMEFSLETDAGAVRLRLPLPGRSQPPAETILREMAEKEQVRVRFDAEVNARGLEVLEIGARLLPNHAEAPRERFPKARRYVGMDVHPGPMVDIVGDVHELSRLVGCASFDAVVSSAVLEHLAMPWIVAGEINRVLRPGGLTYHIAPQSWPVHEEPNDFWRFTDEALKLLFGEPFGFEVLSAGMADRARIYPLNKEWGDLGLPFGYGYASAWVLARKVREIEGGDAAPSSSSMAGALAASLAVLGRRYPRAG
ncbi:MAG TPA: methyltransferase domain-containing protein, partial [Acetobacteraceae bacterium]|nr:methyltransferase domain-containing protein [Acetobacteraceae bacterium]